MVVSVAGEAAERSVFLGPRGLLKVAAPGSLLIDAGTVRRARTCTCSCTACACMCTSRAAPHVACAPCTCPACMQVSVEFARQLHAASAAAGVSFLDAPVSGGPEGAANGSLSIMAGGSEARGPNTIRTVRATTCRGRAEQPSLVWYRPIPQPLGSHPCAVRVSGGLRGGQASPRRHGGLRRAHGPAGRWRRRQTHKPAPHREQRTGGHRGSRPRARDGLRLGRTPRAAARSARALVGRLDPNPDHRPKP